MPAETATDRLQAPLVSKEIRDYFGAMPKGETYIEEAEFGLRRILPLLADLPAGARALEVGSGPCIVLAEISERFPRLTIQGIEPMSHGFAFFDEFVNRMRKARSGMNIHLGGYESFPRSGTWDLIFLVNVFEHLPDWQDFLGFIGRSLAPGGRCLILCPNYGFPYESHFGLPVIWNKRITGALFRQRIDRFEQMNGVEGLYHSLNFVRLSQVRKAVREKGLTLDVDTGIVREMIRRLGTDPAFRQRKRIMALPAIFLDRTGLLDRLLRLRIVEDYLPYMQITLRRIS